MSSRRQFMQQLSAMAGLGSLCSLGLGLKSSQVMAADAGWFMPDESQPQARIFVAYAAQVSVWKDWAEPVNETIGLLTRTIAAYQPVTVLCPPQQLSAAKAACGSRNTTFLSLPLDDVWCRDYGGCFVLNADGGLGLVDVGVTSRNAPVTARSLRNSVMNIWRPTSAAN